MITIDVEVHEGRISSKNGAELPAHAEGVLWIKSPLPTTRRNVLERDPTLPKIVYLEHPATPLHKDEWPEECR